MKGFKEIPTGLRSTGSQIINPVLFLLAFTLVWLIEIQTADHGS